MKDRITTPDAKILEMLNAMCPATLMETLNIRYTAVGERSLSCQMIVGDNMMRPGGILHGGATMALIETVGSSASCLFMDPEKEIVLGIDVSSNHISTGHKGDVLTATATAIHIGRTTQLWDVEVVNQNGRLISKGKVTNIVMPSQVIKPNK
ncbi:MAG: PaaI family thioesterase [Flavobacteriales bacterium]|nr:PaaI family thioesterase [Flavobacteriales bacterium]